MLLCFHRDCLSTRSQQAASLHPVLPFLLSRGRSGLDPRWPNSELVILALDVPVPATSGRQLRAFNQGRSGDEALTLNQSTSPVLWAQKEAVLCPKKPSARDAGELNIPSLARKPQSSTLTSPVLAKGSSLVTLSSLLLLLFCLRGLPQVL